MHFRSRIVLGKRLCVIKDIWYYVYRIRFAKVSCFASVIIVDWLRLSLSSSYTARVPCDVRLHLLMRVSCDVHLAGFRGVMHSMIFMTVLWWPKSVRAVLTVTFDESYCCTISYCFYGFNLMFHWWVSHPVSMFHSEQQKLVYANKCPFLGAL
jgi:hypothetical protein